MSSFKDKPLKKCHTDNRKMIDDIHQELIQELTEDEKNQYYLENALLLDKYYSNQVKESENNNVSEGILNFFKRDEESDSEVSQEHLTKKKVINEYMSHIDDTVLDTKFSEDLIDKCMLCKKIMKYNIVEGNISCSQCGYTEKVLIINEKGSYNDPPREANYFAYKRINHFNEWLAQFQAKGSSELPDTIYRDVYVELNKSKNLDITKLNYSIVRNILKKLKYNKYYEHIPHLINVLSGEKAPSLSRKSEDTLRSLFKEIQIPFMNNCPSYRKNFLSYSYVLHKFCQLLEYDHLLPFFPFLKSREKLIQQDQIWEKMCKELQWQFIPSA